MTTSSFDTGPGKLQGDTPTPPRPNAEAKPHAYTRFIPREELHSYAAWNPQPLGGGSGHTIHSGVGRAAQAPDPEQLMQAARQEGYQQGYRDGLSALEGFKQSFEREANARIGALLRNFDEQIQGLETQMAETLLHSAVQLARLVVRQELAQNPELVAEVAREALAALLLSARHIVVHVHPDDLDRVEQGAGAEVERRGGRLLADPAVSRGGCMIESDIGRVDATLETRWLRAAANLGSTLPLDGEPT